MEVNFWYRIDDNVWQKGGTHYGMGTILRRETRGLLKVYLVRFADAGTYWVNENALTPD